MTTKPRRTSRRGFSHTRIRSSRSMTPSSSSCASFNNHPAITAVFGSARGAGSDLYASGAAPSEATRLGARDRSERARRPRNRSTATLFHDSAGRAGAQTVCGSPGEAHDAAPVEVIDVTVEPPAVPCNVVEQSVEGSEQREFSIKAVPAVWAAGEDSIQAGEQRIYGVLVVRHRCWPAWACRYLVPARSRFQG
jgi:hypothetical protein